MSYVFAETIPSIIPEVGTAEGYVFGESDGHIVTINGQRSAFMEVTGIGPQGPPGTLQRYVKVLPAGTSITIPPEEHNLPSVSNVTALTGSFEEVDVYKKILPDKTVMIQSNVSFENYQVTLL